MAARQRRRMSCGVVSHNILGSQQDIFLGMLHLHFQQRTCSIRRCDTDDTRHNLGTFPCQCSECCGIHGIVYICVAPDGTLCTKFAHTPFILTPSRLTQILTVTNSLGSHLSIKCYFEWLSGGFMVFFHHSFIKRLRIAH